MKKLCILAIALFLVYPSLGTAQSPTTDATVLRLRYVTVLVKNYDEALSWYTGVLGMKKVEDRDFGRGQRWLVVAPEGANQLGIVLETLRADGTRNDRLGKETNWVFQVSDCAKFSEALKSHGVHFIQPPTRQPWGTMQAVFEDPYGNIFVIESPAARNPAKPSGAL